MPSRCPAGEKGEGTRGKGQPEVGLPASGSGAWSVKRVTCSSSAFPQQAPGLGYCCIPAGCWDAAPERGGGCPALPQVLLAAGLRPLLRAVAACRCRWPSGKLLALVLQLGGLGKCKRHRSILTPCFLTPCHCTIISFLWGRRGMHRSIRQAGAGLKPPGNAF